ncbi:MAG TPA: hypothetical protein VD971_04265 [Phycisphaerales bacterium]|nr:hypothetical protein [Phycisphaerales bacterium]
MTRKPMHAVLPALLALLGGTAAMAQMKTTPSTPRQSADKPIPLDGVSPPRLTGTNAALLYFQAWQSVPQATMQKLGNPDNKAEQVAALEENQRLIEAILTAAETRDCDWGIQYQEGMHALLPYLGALRQSCRAISADVERLVAEGGDENQRAAGRRLAAMVNMSQHVRNDRVLISSLVGVAITVKTLVTADELMQTGALGVEPAQKLVAALRALPKDDPFGTRECIIGERDVFLTWAKRKYTEGDEGGARMIRDMEDMGTSGADDPDVAGMEGEELKKEFERAEQYFTSAYEVWNEPDAAEELQDLADRVQDGDFGAVASVLAPALTTCHKSDTRGRKDLAAAIVTLDAYIRNEGKLPPEFLKKPAE